jgi:Fe2+ transport system protein B
MNKTLVNNDEMNNTNYRNFDLLNSIPNENLINMANTIDTISMDDLNGTAMDMLNNTSNIKLPIQKLFNRNDMTIKYKKKNNNDNDNNNDNYKDDNETLIKSLTKEILNNLQEQELNELNEADEACKEDDIEDFRNSPKKEKMKSLNKSSKHKERFDNTYYGLVFDKCFGIKDFILLFSVYFLLSQDMIKDFFSKYFTSLNPDSEGKVNVQGVIIYGLILTVLFTMSRKFI